MTIKKVLIILIMTCGIAGSALFFATYTDARGNIKGGVLSEGIISGYTAKEIEAMLQQEADESMFSFEINACPVFYDGKSEGNLRIANPPYNKYAIEVDITLDETGKTIFQSGRIDPMHYIENAKLTKNLPQNTYEATATITAYDTQTGEQMGISAVKMTIFVQN